MWVVVAISMARWQEQRHMQEWGQWHELASYMEWGLGTGRVTRVHVRTSGGVREEHGAGGAGRARAGGRLACIMHQ